jgi:hypothetical protein
VSGHDGYFTLVGGLSHRTKYSKATVVVAAGDRVR